MDYKSNESLVPTDNNELHKSGDIIDERVHIQDPWRFQ